MLQKSRFVALVLGGLLLVGSAMPMVADTCEDRLRRDDEKVKRETEHHGEHSKQAESARRNLEKDRANCHVDEHHDEHHEDEPLGAYDHDHR